MLALTKRTVVLLNVKPSNGAPKAEHLPSLPLPAKVLGSWHFTEHLKYLKKNDTMLLLVQKENTLRMIVLRFVALTASLENKQTTDFFSLGKSDRRRTQPKKIQQETEF